MCEYDESWDKFYLVNITEFECEGIESRKIEFR